MSTIHLFIDTSAFLTFYAYTSDNLEELKKIVALIKTDKLKLYVPSQVADEFQRNREGKLAQSLKEFSSGGLIKSVPRFMAEYEDVENFLDAGKAYQQAREKLVQKATHDAAARNLPADKLFSSIIEAAELIAVSDSVLEKANRRRLQGNPPGKKDSIGDQINWEILLEMVPVGQDLHIVAKDGDYESALDSDIPHQFLELEWNSLKQSKIQLHKQLKLFLNANFSEFEFALDIEKVHAIEALIYSGNFSNTHAAISSLKPYKDEIVWEEAKKIFDAGITNNQISWIGTDEDVNDFYRMLMTKFYPNTSIEMDEKLDEVFPELLHTDGSDDDVPF